MADYQGSTTNPAYRDMTQTPRWLYEALNAEFNFCLDAAALPETALHSNYLTPEIDALSVSWGDYIPADIRSPFVWLNPPYSDIGPWIMKCLEEKECGIGSVVLIPEDASAEWWPADQCSEVWRICGYYNEKGKWCSGRINFINAETGEEMKGNPKGSNFLIFTPKANTHTTKHVSKGDLLNIGNGIIKLAMERDQQNEVIADQADTEINELIEVNKVLVDKVTPEVERLIENEELDEKLDAPAEDEPDEDYSDKTIEQIYSEHPDTAQRRMIMLSVLFGRKEAYSHREMQFSSSALLTNGEITGTIAEYENAMAINEAMTKYSRFVPSPTVAHSLVCGMLAEYKYPANRTLNENLKLLEKLNYEGDTNVGHIPDTDNDLKQDQAQPISDLLRDRYMKLEDFSDLNTDAQQEAIDKTIQAIGYINNEYADNELAPRAEEFIDDYFSSNPNVRIYMNMRPLRAAFRNLVGEAIKRQAA